MGLSSERLQRISTRLQQDVDEGVYPRAVVLVARRGKIAYFESFGLRDKDTGAPMPKDAIFRIFSTTKPIVSVATMMLHEEGRFLLWEPVEKYLPAFKDMKLGVEGPVFSTVPVKRRMTIHDLLRHTSGLTYEEGAGGSQEKSVVKAMLGRLLEVVSGQPLDELLAGTYLRDLTPTAPTARRGLS